MEHYGILSVVAPLITILIALVYKDVLLALFSGVLVGSIIGHGWDFLPATVNYIMNDGIKGNASLLTVLVFFGPLIAFLTKAGGFKAFVELAKKKVTSAKSSLVLTWFFCIITGISTTFSLLGVGIIMKPLTDRFKVPREKLGFILSASGPPVEALLPFTLWIVFYGSVISKVTGLDGAQEYIKAIPYNFYAMISIIGAALFAYKIIPDFGKMKQVERRAKETGQLWREGAELMDVPEINSMKIGENVKPSFLTFIIPMLTAVVISLYTFISSGNVQLALAFLCALLVVIVFSMFNGNLKLNEISSTWFLGFKTMGPAMLILILALALSGVAKKVGFAPYIIEMTSGFLKGNMIPVGAFVICCITSFATGSSAGTVALVAPLVLPLAMALNAPLSLTIASTLGGALWGDESSPVSDLAIKAAMGAGANISDFINAQLLYKLTFGAITIVLIGIASFIF